MENLEITDKKTIFYKKYIGRFDTPKRLNRSTKSVPMDFVNMIEDGKASSVKIQDIQAKFPVFTYRTCLTVHGNFPTVERTRIGGYKNIHQNSNGSLEIRWSAVDYDLKKQLADFLAFGGWRKQENSTDGIFYEYIQKTQDKQEALKILQDIKQKAENLNVNGLLCKIYAHGFNYCGTYYLILTVCPLSIYGNPLNIASQITSISDAELNDKKEAKEKAETERQAKYEQEARERDDKKQKAMQEALKTVIGKREAKITDAHGVVYIVPVVNVNFQPAFRFYKVGNKGTFGRYQVFTYISTNPEFNLEKLEPYMKGKQVKLTDVTAKSVYIY